MTQKSLWWKPGSARWASGFLLCLGILIPLYLPPPTQEDLQGTLLVSASSSPTSTDSPGTMTPTFTPDFSPSPSPSPTSTVDPSLPSATLSTTTTPPDTPSPSPSVSPTGSPPATSTAEPSPTFTSTPKPPGSTPYPPQALLINEIAWAGSLASSSDEWIELHNPGPDPIDLAGWRLSDGGDIGISLQGRVMGYSYYLLERTDDTTVADIQADLIYTGSLNNSGELLTLTDPSGVLIDTANGSGGWYAGDSTSRASMERRGGDDRPGHWATFNGCCILAHDAAGNPIPGTPRYLNSMYLSTPTPTPPHLPTTPTPAGPDSVWINEVAWAGTIASSSDEWIELANPSDGAISLDGWTLTDGGDLEVELQGTLPAHGYYLLERSDDSAISDIQADGFFTGALSNTGERLWLIDASGSIVSTVNQDGGPWPAGNAGDRRSMERRGAGDEDSNWGTFTGYYGLGRDKDGHPIGGTPGGDNSLFFPTPVPTWIPGRVVINEVLIKPRHDWEGTGGVTTGDEFIELYNHGPFSVYLGGWSLDDQSEAGSKPYRLPGVTIAPGGYAVFFRSRTRIALNDGGDSVRLTAPDGSLIDKIIYRRFQAYNLSYGRLPDGSSHFRYDLWPTPGQPNLQFMEPTPEPWVGPLYPSICPGGMWPAGNKEGRQAMVRSGVMDTPENWSESIIIGFSSGIFMPAMLPMDRAIPDNFLNALNPPTTSHPTIPRVIIAEVAWAGSALSPTDEWIRLVNTNPDAVNLTGWILTDSGDIHILLHGILPGGGSYLLERSDDDSRPYHQANAIYTGALRDTGETLLLFDSQGKLVDSANRVRYGWPQALLPRLERRPEHTAWLRELGLVACRER